MVYSFGRVSAVIGMDVDDVYLHGARRWIRLREKGGKEHAVPLHHHAEECLLAYTAAAGIAEGPLFRATIGGRITTRRIGRLAAWEMAKRRARDAGLPPETTNHTFRATGITVYLENGGTIENARLIAAHASIRTTQAYDRRGENVTLDEISRIRL
ncbi:MAG: tyrosine-type recombinase/integrase [Phycisphaerales bacterium]